MGKERGVSPLISGILYTAISISAVGIVLDVGVPYMKNLEDISAINKAKVVMGQLDQEILRIAASGTGSSTQVNLAIQGTNFVVSSNGSIVKMEKNTKAQIIKKRFRKNFGNFFLCSNCTTNAYKATTDQGSVLVLENSHIKLQVARLDANTINTPLTDLVKRVAFKDANKNFLGTYNFYPDSYSSTLNTVSTRIVEEGYSLGEGEIITYVSSPYYTYNLHFNLQSDADWFSVFVTDMNNA